MEQRSPFIPMAPFRESGEREFVFTNADFERVRKLIYDHAGISLSPAKQDMVYSRLARRLRKTRLRTFGDYLALLEKAQLIGQLRDDTGGMRGLGKVEKVYIDNPSLMTVLSGGKSDIGNMRETFFYNQMRVENDVVSSRQSDFVIGDRTFEIGGRNKGKRQIEDLPDSYIVKDDIEFAHGNTLPLWSFGLNY